MQGMIAGALASGVATVILYPWQKLRIQMQTNREDESIKNTIQRIVSRQGWTSLYKGLKPFLMGSMLSYAIYFLFYQYLKRGLPPDPTLLQLMWTTAISGSVTSFLVNPFWVLQTTTALSQTNESMVVAAKRLVRNDGMASLWKGLSSSLILVSNPIIQFCVYEWLKARLPASKVGLAKDILIFLIAALSKAIATILTYPYTVIRTYQHLNKSEKPFSEIVRELYAEGGLLRFFKGMSPKMIQTVLNSAVMLVLYERLSKIFLHLIQVIELGIKRVVANRL